jgi:23S rRNA (cytidine1920-2'-O)/16S rRNA (cytidine1409-2'-O)-methyltransferase
VSRKERLDIVLYSRGFFPSRERARSAIMAGVVFVNGVRVDKPGTQLDPQVDIEVRGPDPAFVSRGGLKLEKALQAFGIDLTGEVVLDVGASTGGFTDCALKHGAALVYAVDAGYGQLDWSLRRDPRVVVLERTNIRYLAPSALRVKPSFFTIDVSFISLKLVLPRVDELTVPEARGIALVKPQFEAGRNLVGKKGVVRDPGVHAEVLLSILEVAETLGWGVRALDYSPVRGPQGNIEFLVYFQKGSPTAAGLAAGVRRVVDEAHVALAAPGGTF